MHRGIVQHRVGKLSALVFTQKRSVVDHPFAGYTSNASQCSVSSPLLNHFRRNITDVSNESLAMTGNAHNYALTTEMLHDPRAFLASVTRHTEVFRDRHQSRYVVPAVDVEQAEHMRHLFDSFVTSESSQEAFFKRLMRRLPSMTVILGTPSEVAQFLDLEEKKTAANRLIKGRINWKVDPPSIRLNVVELLKVSMDHLDASAEEYEKAISTLVLTMFHDSFVGASFWMHVAECLQEVLLQDAKTPMFTRLVVHRSTERVFKTCANVLDSQPWAPEMFTSSFSTQLGTNRSNHEAGMW